MVSVDSLDGEEGRIWDCVAGYFLGHYISTFGVMGYCSIGSCQRVIDKSYLWGVCTGQQKVNPLI